MLDIELPLFLCSVAQDSISLSRMRLDARTLDTESRLTTAEKRKIPFSISGFDHSTVDT